MLSVIQLTIRRARKERLAQIAGSLTFTTVLSVVPFLAVTFALFTRFPWFGRFRQAIEDFLLSSLLPVEIARTVLKYLNQFAANAHALTLVGSLFVLATAVALLLTVENALNQIWMVKRNRPFLKRVGMYVTMMVAGPPLLGASLWATSYALSASIDLVGPVPPSVKFILTLGPFVLGALTLASLFYFVPNAGVRRRDAIAGGVVASIGFELCKRAFAAYLLKAPTYKTLYGAFAVFPVFLLWIYFSWLVTLASALLTSNLSRARRRPAGKSAQP